MGHDRHVCYVVYCLLRAAAINCDAAAIIIDAVFFVVGFYCSSSPLFPQATGNLLTLSNSACCMIHVDVTLHAFHSRGVYYHVQPNGFGGS